MSKKPPSNSIGRQRATEFSMNPKLKYLDTSNFKRASVLPKETGTKSISQRYAEQQFTNHQQSARIMSELEARKISVDKKPTPTDKRFAR